jgi:hypothetical protein
MSTFLSRSSASARRGRKDGEFSTLHAADVKASGTRLLEPLLAVASMTRAAASSGMFVASSVEYQAAPPRANRGSANGGKAKPDNSYRWAGSRCTYTTWRRAKMKTSNHYRGIRDGHRVAHGEQRSTTIAITDLKSQTSILANPALQCSRTVGARMARAADATHKRWEYAACRRPATLYLQLGCRATHRLYHQ